MPGFLHRLRIITQVIYVVSHFPGPLPSRKLPKLGSQCPWLHQEEILWERSLQLKPSSDQNRPSRVRAWGPSKIMGTGNQEQSLSLSCLFYFQSRDKGGPHSLVEMFVLSCVMKAFPSSSTTWVEYTVWQFIDVAISLRWSEALSPGGQILQSTGHI